MKQLSLFLFLWSWICPLYLLAQINMQRSYGGAGHERGHAITATTDGGYTLAGYTTSFGAGGRDFFVMKVNALGLIEWQKTYGSQFDDYGVSMAMKEAPGGGYIIVGSGNSTNTSTLDGIVFKVDATGNVLWYKAYDSGSFQNSGDHARGIAFAANGDILISGTDDGDVFGSNDGLLMRLEPDGDLLWSKVYGDHANEHFLESIELPGGNIISCGSTQTFGPGPRAAYIVKTDSQGNLIWSKGYGGQDEEHLQSILATSDNQFVVAGVCSSFGAGEYDALLFKVDSNGVQQWAKTYGGEENEWGVGITPTHAGDGYLMACYTESFGAGSRDILIIRTNLQGDVIWSKTFGTSGYESVDTWANTTLVSTPDDGFALTAWSDSLSIEGDDILLIKSNGAGDALCDDAAVIVTIAELTSLDNDTGEGTVGTYVNQTPQVLTPSFSSRSFCHCGVQCEPCDVHVVMFDLDDCYSNTTNGSDMDYSEFVPSYPSELSFATISATNIFRENAGMNKHSCTPGVENSVAMCVSSVNSCSYSAGHLQSVVFEMTIDPHPDSAVSLNTLSFFEKAPTNFDWINGPSGPNNYPTRFGIRVLKNGTEVFAQGDLATSIDTWTERQFDFPTEETFIAFESTTFRFELLAYCLIDNGAAVAAWDLDQIRIAVNCMPAGNNTPNISGIIRNTRGEPLSNVKVLLSDSPAFDSTHATLTQQDGSFIFENTEIQGTRFIKAEFTENDMSEITVLDMVALQKHLLGLSEFTLPYQFIAADVSNSTSLTAMDLVLFRKFLLGTINHFPAVPSWRFCDASYLPDMTAPWDFREWIEVPYHAVNIGNVHFTGIQSGNVYEE